MTVAAPANAALTDCNRFRRSAARNAATDGDRLSPVTTAHSLTGNSPFMQSPPSSAFDSEVVFELTRPSGFWTANIRVYYEEQRSRITTARPIPSAIVRRADFGRFLMLRARPDREEERVGGSRKRLQRIRASL